MDRDAFLREAIAALEQMEATPVATDREVALKAYDKLLYDYAILEGKEAHVLATYWVMDESTECLRLTLVTIENLQRLIQKAKQSDASQVALDSRYQYLYGCCILVTLRKLLEIVLHKDNAACDRSISKVIDHNTIVEFCEEESVNFEDDAISVRVAMGISSLLQFDYLDDPRVWDSTSLVNECQSCLILLAQIKKYGSPSQQDLSRSVQENLLGFMENVSGCTANSQLFSLIYEALKAGFGLPSNLKGINGIDLHHLEDISFLAGMIARLTRNQQMLKVPSVLRSQIMDTLHLVSEVLHSLGAKPVNRCTQKEILHGRRLALSVAAMVEFLVSSTPGPSSQMLEDMLLKSGLFIHMIQAFKSFPRDIEDDVILLGRSLLAVSAFSLRLREWASRVSGYTDAWESLGNDASIQLSLLIAIYHSSVGKQGINSLPLDAWMDSTIHSLQISNDKASCLSQLYPALQTLHLIQSCMSSSANKYENDSICSIGSLENGLGEIKKLQQENAFLEDNTGIGEVDKILDSDQDEEKTNKGLGTKYNSQHVLLAQCHVLLKSLLAKTKSSHKVD